MITLIGTINSPQFNRNYYSRFLSNLTFIIAPWPISFGLNIKGDIVAKFNLIFITLKLYSFLLLQVHPNFEIRKKKCLIETKIWS